MKIVYKILEVFGYVAHLKFGSASRRSPLWEKCKRDFAAIYPKRCAVCGKTKVQLHHKQAFHAHPELELDFLNLVWLCEGAFTQNHHLNVGHLGDFKSINDEIDHWVEKINHRPYWNKFTKRWE